MALNFSHILPPEALAQVHAAGMQAHMGGTHQQASQLGHGDRDPNIEQVGQVLTPSMMRAGIGMAATKENAQSLADEFGSGYGAIPKMGSKGTGIGM